MIDIEEQYRRLAPMLTNWLVASGSSYHESCDIVQNTFLKLWKMRDDLQDDENAVSGLVFTIARNLRKNLVRDNSRLSFVGDIRDADENGDGARAVESIDIGSNDGRLETEAGDTAHLRRRLVEAFGRLPPVLREAYTLFQVAEMSVRDIAAQTGVSENLVKVRIFRAKEKLREILVDLRVTL